MPFTFSPFTEFELLMIRTAFPRVFGLAACLLVSGLCIGCGGSPEAEPEMADVEMGEKEMPGEMMEKEEMMAEETEGGSGSK